MSGTDTPEELVLDQAERGDKEWPKKCEKNLYNNEGYQRMLKFVRRYKRKGGQNGGPGSIEDLKNALKNCGLEDMEDIDEHLDQFLEGKGEDQNVWTDLMIMNYTELDEEDKLKFMIELNRIGWIQSSKLAQKAQQE